MATSPSTIEQILSNLGDAIEVDARKMFGEYGLFLDGKMVALVCDDTLFVKSSPAGLELLGDHECAAPYPGAKELPVVSERFMQRRGSCAELFRVTWEALPVPKKKSATKKRQTK
ncbi:MAG: hypothetical protein RL173_1538 [Fibrobacterota bacterium]|jgi:TfoX/Sxy family transcriptional regulator of competence genes